MLRLDHPWLPSDKSPVYVDDANAATHMDLCPFRLLGRNSMCVVLDRRGMLLKGSGSEGEERSLKFGHLLDVSQSKLTVHCVVILHNPEGMPDRFASYGGTCRDSWLAVSRRQVRVLSHL